MTGRKILIALFCLAAFAFTIRYFVLLGDIPADDGKVGLAGTYTVNGFAPTGAEYGGTVVIINTDTPNSFEVEWIVTASLHSGNAILRGTNLDVTWAANDGSISGTGVYELQPNGNLIGNKFSDGVEGHGTEEWFAKP